MTEGGVMQDYPNLPARKESNVKVLKPKFQYSFFHISMSQKKPNKQKKTDASETVMLTDRRACDQSAIMHPTHVILHYTALLQGFVERGGNVCSYI